MSNGFSRSASGFLRASWRRAGVVAVALGAALASCPAAAAEVRAGGPAAARPASVLTLQSYGTAYEPFASFDSLFRTGLAETWPGPVDFFAVPLDQARLEGGIAEAPLTEYLRMLLTHRPVDLVVTEGAPAARFALRQRDRLFPSTPLLLAAVEHRLVDGSRLTARDAAVPGDLDFPAVVENILQVLPKTRTVAVVIGTSPLEKYWRVEVARQFAPFESRVRFLWLDDLPMRDIVRQTATLPPHSAIFYIQVVVDAAGVPCEAQQGLKQILESANAPVFGLFDTFLGTGIVGGPMAPTRTLSRETAAVAVRILKGESPDRLRLPPIPMGTPVFDARALRRWGIPESRLPAGSSVEFRDPSVLRTYLWPLLGFLAVLGLETALVVGLLVERRRRRVAQTEVRALNRRLLTAFEEERSRLARELHDDLSQRLARLGIDAARLERGSADSPGAPGAGAMREEILSLSADMHEISRRLHPSLLDHLGLVEALRAESERFARLERIAVDFRAEETVGDLPPEQALCLYRVAQESLHNVARHAGASRIEVTLRGVRGGVELGVRDDGCGFDPQARRGGAGLGLVSMRERMQLAGGQLRIESGPGRGTAVVAWAPPAGAAS